MTRVCPRCATAVPEWEPQAHPVCRACGIPLAAGGPAMGGSAAGGPAAVGPAADANPAAQASGARRRPWLVPVISATVGLVCLAVIFGAFLVLVGSTTAKRLSGSAAVGTSGSATLASSPGTAVAGSDGFPSLTLKGRFCSSAGVGPYGKVAAGNDATPCEFAANIQMNYVAQAKVLGGQPPTVTAYEAKSGSAVTLRCSGSQPVTCSGPSDLVVYLYGGEATFTP